MGVSRSLPIATHAPTSIARSPTGLGRKGGGEANRGDEATIRRGSGGTVGSPGGVQGQSPISANLRLVKKLNLVHNQCMDTNTEPVLKWVVLDNQDVGSAAQQSIDAEWERIVSIIPVDLEETARQTKALQRRRKIRRAADLLRLILAYSTWDWSSNSTGTWATLQQVGNLSDVAILKRLRKAHLWLQCLVGALLKERRIALKAAHTARVRVIDGSSISAPGSQGTDYRLHLSLDLGSQRIDGVAVTDVHGGETLARHASQPGDIWLGDRGYARRADIGSVLKAKNDVVIRIGWSNFPLLHPDGTPFDLFAWLRQLLDEPGEHMVVIETPDKQRFTVRLIAQRLPQEAADRNRCRVRRRASRKGHTPDKRSLEAAGYIFLITSLSGSQWTPAQILELYPLRWQVELVFKRLKSILDLDRLRAKGPALAQTYLLGKVLVALLMEVMTDQAMQRHPDMFIGPHRPISPWRWTKTCHTFILAAVRGHITWERLIDNLPALKRYLCISSRHDRPYQVSIARDLLKQLLGTEAVCFPLS
jgi:hypothetical protein